MSQFYKEINKYFLVPFLNPLRLPGIKGLQACRHILLEWKKNHQGDNKQIQKRLQPSETMHTIYRTHSSERRTRPKSTNTRSSALPACPTEPQSGARLKAGSLTELVLFRFQQSGFRRFCSSARTLASRVYILLSSLFIFFHLSPRITLMALHGVGRNARPVIISYYITASALFYTLIT